MATTYRFLPWTRRGLAAALPDGGDDGAALPQRAEVGVVVSVSNAGDATTRAGLQGPGDVVGLDPRQVVRTHPRPFTTDAEPNYLAAVDLDAPELPWLFTPSGVPASGHLPPWLVLVVVEDRAGVTVSVPPGAPLPQLRIESGAASELPDLGSSWAWAHVQLIDAAGGPGNADVIAATMTADPDRTVARIMCPRRLIPGRRWIAALVPAFDAGRVRGLGGTPTGSAALAPAWAPGADAVTLPTYYHWEFQTGPEGDFESLAQRLRPHKADTNVGLVPMHVGQAGPPGLTVPAGQPRHLDMDGALRAPAQSDGTLGQVPDALRDGLNEVTRTLADAADGVLDGQVLADASRQPVGPPVYASTHVQRWRVLDRQDPQDATWFRELNLDPRPRVAAGLGAECVRENQEDIVHAAWQQVGDVLAAEAALQRAALGTLVSRSFFRRHVEPMAADRLLLWAAPVAARTPFGRVSVAAGVRHSSLPDAVLDAGLRRALGAAGPAVSHAAHRAGITSTAVRTRLVSGLARGREDLDATRFPRPAISGVPPAALADGTLTGVGLPVAITPAESALLQASARGIADTPPVPAEERLAVRADVRRVGLVSQAHVEAARSLSRATLAAVADDVVALPTATVLSAAASALLDGLVSAAASSSSATPGSGPGVGLLVEGPALDLATGVLAAGEDPVRVGVLDLDAGRTLVLRTGAGRANLPVALLESVPAGGDLVAMLGRLPVGAVTRPAPGAARENLPVLRGGVAPGTGFSPVFRASNAGPASTVAASTPEASAPAASAGRRTGVGLTGTGAAAGRMTVGAAGAVRPGATGAGRPVGTRPGPVGPVGPPVVVGPGPRPVVVPDPVVVRPPRGDDGRVTVVVPPLVTDAGTLQRFEAALAVQRDVTAIVRRTPAATLVPLDADAATAAVRRHVDPTTAQPARRDAILRFARRRVVELTGSGEPMTVDGWWATRALDRVMAYPTFPVPASDYLSRYDRTRFCPGIDTIPTDSVTLLETNPRFIASFMVGLNHETNRELLWRGYPTDSRGTPFRRFWRRLDGTADIPPIHGWRTGTLAEQTSDPRGNLVLLLRGDLLRRYPNTIVVAMPALGPRQPDHSRVMAPIFSGQFDPDVSFFGFPLVDTDLQQGEGWFFGLMEPVTEPRFGLDETEGEPAAGGASSAADRLSWPDAGVEPGGHVGLGDFPALALNVASSRADDIAATFFQRPFALYVHARHLVNPLPPQT